MEQQIAPDNVAARPRPTFGMWSVATPLVVLLASVLLYVLYPRRGGLELLVPSLIGIAAVLLSSIVGLVFLIVAFVRKERGRALRIIGLLLNTIPIALVISICVYNCLRF